MITNKSKLERVLLDEITKIGNLFDTVSISYCVLGGYALLANGIRSKDLDCMIITEKEKKDKILSMIFKLNYTVLKLTPDKMLIKKETAGGDMYIEVLFGETEGKTFKLNLDNREIVYPKKIFNNERTEVWGFYRKGAGSKGYFRPASLEEMYFFKLNSESDKDIADLEMIKGSGKLNVDRLLKLFKANKLI